MLGNLSKGKLLIIALISFWLFGIGVIVLTLKSDSDLVKKEPVVSEVDLARELQDCLPKSDMGSKQKCDQLLKTIVTFGDCVRAGFPVAESYPETCRTPDGRTFTSVEEPRDRPLATTLKGEYTCLPHKKTSGPVTLECAFGLKADDGFHYALDTYNLPKDQIFGLQTGQRVEVRGNLVPIEAISSDRWQKYDIKGIMAVETFNKI